MEPMEAVLVLVLTVLLMFIVMSPATWSSSSSAAAAAAAGACDGELYGYPSSCIATRLDFVFSPGTPYSLFDDDIPSCNKTASVNSDDPVPSTVSGDPVDDPVPPPCMPESA